MARELVHHMDARQAMKNAFEKTIKVVEITLGPKGRTVVLDKTNVGGTCIITNDGVSIVKEIELTNEFENQISRFLIEVALKTNQEVGDGTTTSMVLANAMLQCGLRYIEAGANPIGIRRGMKKALTQVIQSLEKQAVVITKLSQIEQIAKIASRDDEVGTMIAKAMEEVTMNGFITMEESKSRDTTLRIVQGMRLTTGYLSRYMCNEKKEKKVQYANPYLFITNQIINKVQQIMPLLELVTEQKRPLLIIAGDVTEEALTTIVLNDVKGNFVVSCVKAPGFGELQKDILEDIAIRTGAICFDQEKGIELTEVSLSMLGELDQVKIDEAETILVGGRGEHEKITNRIIELEKQMNASSSEFNKERFRERISKLTTGIAILQIGADSEIEMIEKKLRIEDAIMAVKAGVQEGLIIGGGCAYVHAIADLKQYIEKLQGDEAIGGKIIEEALRMPCYQIGKNAGQDGSVIVEKVKSMGVQEGYDALEDQYGNMYAFGVVDPLKVSKCAIINAESVCSTLLTTEAINVIKKGTETPL